MCLELDGFLIRGIDGFCVSWLGKMGFLKFKKG